MIGHASVVDDGSDECRVDDEQDASGRSPCRSGYRENEVQSDFASVDDVVDVCCPCEALVEDDAEELHRLLELDRDLLCDAWSWTIVIAKFALNNSVGITETCCRTIILLDNYCSLC